MEMGVQENNGVRKESRTLSKKRTWDYCLHRTKYANRSDEVKDYLNKHMPGKKEVSKNQNKSRGSTEEQRKYKRKHVDISSSCGEKEIATEGTTKPQRSHNDLSSATIPHRQALTIDSLRVHNAIIGARDQHQERNFVVRSACSSAKLEELKEGRSQQLQNFQQSHNRTTNIDKSLQMANDILMRCKDRASIGSNFLPRNFSGTILNVQEIVQMIDADVLCEWKTAVVGQQQQLKESGRRIDFKSMETGIPWELKKFLDDNLGNWMGIDNSSQQKG